MKSPVLLTAIALAGFSVASTVQVESNPTIPEGWNKLSKTPSPKQALRLTFAMRQPDIDKLESQMSSCKKASRHLTRDEVLTLRTPDQEDVNEVLAWLKDNNLAAKVTEDKDWIHVPCTVKQAESLLGAKFNYYQFEDKKPVLRTRQYSVPKSLADAISFVHPIANFMPERKDLTSPCAHEDPDQDEIAKRDAPCLYGTVPDCIRKLYNFNYKTPDGNSSIRLGVAGFLDEYANFQDIDQWMSEKAPAIAKTGYNFSVELINGGINSQELAKSGAEAALDMQYALALAYPAQITYHLAGGRGPKLDEDGKLLPEKNSNNEPYLEFLDHLLDKPDNELPHVLSISYADNEVQVPRLYAERVCQMFGLLTARGTTILAGSGDGGAKGSSNSSCRTVDGSNKDVAMAVFPASCPWVTGIGAVTNNLEPPLGASFSGGGFSQYFGRPTWQDAAVKSYVLKLKGHLSGYYNPRMRAVPDISAIGTRFQVRYGGKPGSLMGTSASTPVIASMLALINDARVREGKPVLGWINKALYSAKVRAALQDVTAGQSLSCNFRKGGMPGGWPAAPGYDAITGLGVTKDFEKLKKVLMEL